MSRPTGACWQSGGTQASARAQFGASVPSVLSGWPYGGFLALLHAMRNPGDARAVLAGNPVLDWSVQHELAPPHLRRLQEDLLGAHLETTARETLYRERSPLTHARNLRDPTLILFAAADVRCPASAVEALRREAEAAPLPIHFRECSGGHLSAEFDAGIRRAIFEAGFEFVERVIGSAKQEDAGADRGRRERDAAVETRRRDHALRARAWASGCSQPMGRWT